MPRSPRDARPPTTTTPSTPPATHASARAPRAAAPPRRAPTRTRAVPPPQPRSITLAGQVIPYVLKTSARARRLRLVIRPSTGLEVVVPLGADLPWAERAIRERSAWIHEKLAEMATHAVAPPPPLTDGRVLSFLGEPIRLAIRNGAPAGRFRAALREGVLTLTVASTAEETVRAALEAWYRKQARTIVPERLAICNMAYGFRYGRVAIKDQKSRWGSCSRKGNLNFNWRLLLAPLPVLDYVVYHELAHLQEPNHAPRFWAVVERACPQYREHRRWLKQHGHELRF